MASSFRRTTRPGLGAVKVEEHFNGVWNKDREAHVNTDVFRLGIGCWQNDPVSSKLDFV